LGLRVRRRVFVVVFIVEFCSGDGVGAFVFTSSL